MNRGCIYQHRRGLAARPSVDDSKRQNFVDRQVDGFFLRFFLIYVVFIVLVFMYWTVGQSWTSLTPHKCLNFFRSNLFSFHYWFCHTADSDDHRINRSNCYHAIHLHVPSHVTVWIRCNHWCHGRGWIIYPGEGDFGASRQLESMVAMAPSTWKFLRLCILLTCFDVQGLFSGRWYFKLFNFSLSLGSAAMACLGKFTSWSISAAFRWRWI